mmetsp:Transcript_107457/g.342526  ORF Transcript_107457/g.342526 Transcript_107457/m.342526 type:complete len:125 (-) Transcript_107457:164-538(-)
MPSNNKTLIFAKQVVRAVLLNNQKKPRKTCIVKPQDGSQGTGIFLIQTVGDLERKIFTKPKKAIFDPGSHISKRPLSVALHQIQAEFPEFNQERFFERAAALARTAVALMAPVLVSYSRGAGGG